MPAHRTRVDAAQYISNCIACVKDAREDGEHIEALDHIEAAIRRLEGLRRSYYYRCRMEALAERD